MLTVCLHMYVTICLHIVTVCHNMSPYCVFRRGLSHISVAIFSKLHLYIFSHTFVIFANSDLLPHPLSCSCQPSLCLYQVSCYLELKLDAGCPLLCKWEVCCSCLSQHLAVLLLIHSKVNLFFPKTCNVLVWLPQLIIGNVLPTTVLLTS